MIVVVSLGHCVVCRVECNTGYRVVGNDTFTCVSVNDTVEWRNNGFHCDIGNVKYSYVFSYMHYKHVIQLQFFVSVSVIQRMVM